MLREQLPARLKAFRKAANMTTADVGARIGKSDRTVNAWENGRGQPDADTLLALCDIYGINSISELLGDASDKAVYSLLPDEEQLISFYRSLNQQGKEYLLQTAHLAAQVYKKSSDIPGVEVVAG